MPAEVMSPLPGNEASRKELLKAIDIARSDIGNVCP
jgi:hypothetical protein